MFFNKIKSINNISELKKEDIIDVRTSSEIKYTGKIKGSRNVEMSMLLADPSKYLKKDKAYFILCQSGMRSKKVTKALSKLGYDVTNIKGGYRLQSNN